jgi:hypothetical protein
MTHETIQFTDDYFSNNGSFIYAEADYYPGCKSHDRDQPDDEPELAITLLQYWPSGDVKRAINVYHYISYAHPAYLRKLEAAMWDEAVSQCQARYEAQFEYEP